MPPKLIPHKSRFAVIFIHSLREEPQVSQDDSKWKVYSQMGLILKLQAHFKEKEFNRKHLINITELKEKCEHVSHHIRGAGVS